MIIRLAEGQLRTKYGEWQEALYYDGQRETIAFYLGNIEGAEDLLCRLHSSCIFGHYFNSLECDCQEQMDVSMQLIQQAGKGIIILLDQEGKGNGHFALLNSVAYKRKGLAQADAYEAVGFKRDNRDFSAAAKILQDLGVKSVRMLTANKNKIKTLADVGVEVKGMKAVSL